MRILFIHVCLDSCTFLHEWPGIFSASHASLKKLKQGESSFWSKMDRQTFPGASREFGVTISFSVGAARHVYFSLARLAFITFCMKTETFLPPSLTCGPSDEVALAGQRLCLRRDQFHSKYCIAAFNSFLQCGILCFFHMFCICLDAYVHRVLGTMPLRYKESNVLLYINSYQRWRTTSILVFNRLVPSIPVKTTIITNGLLTSDCLGTRLSHTGKMT